MKLQCKPLFEGIMAYWDKVEETAHYNVMLYIDDNIIAHKNIERTELYCYFKGLASIGHWETQGHMQLDGRRIYVGSKYFIQVEAANCKGEIIDKSEKVECIVKNSI